MSINFNLGQMEELLSSFYSLSGIKCVLFDTEGNEVAAWPKDNCEFCALMKSNQATRRRCRYADKRSFEMCKNSQSPIQYKCHTGLTEAVLPLRDNEQIIGYLMFGQIADNEAKEELYGKIPQWGQITGVDRETFENAIEKINVKSPQQITAAAKIMEACTSFIIFKELITPENSRIFQRVTEYIDSHLGNELSVEEICNNVNIGRTKLYEIFRKEAKTGIAAYIKKRRLHRAKKLLKTTDMTVAEISDTVGFADYNYFQRSFKQRYGKSAGTYRK